MKGAVSDTEDTGLTQCPRPSAMKDINQMKIILGKDEGAHHHHLREIEEDIIIKVDMGTVVIEEEVVEIIVKVVETEGEEGEDHMTQHVQVEVAAHLNQIEEEIRGGREGQGQEMTRMERKRCPLLCQSSGPKILNRAH
jgi:GTPase involved in cell partitioning and DNA repair